MATFTITWIPDEVVSTSYFKVRYRLMGASSWTSFNVPSSGTTASFSGQNNLIYDGQVQNINNDNNPISATAQAIVFTDPNPVISPTNISVGYSFNNLSADIDTYTGSVALASSPGVPLATHILTPATVVTDAFAGLTPLTDYILSITPAANQFYQTFTYSFTTGSVAECADPQDSLAYIL